MRGDDEDEEQAGFTTVQRRRRRRRPKKSCFDAQGQADEERRLSHMEARDLFWKNVNEDETEERLAIEEEVTKPRIELESGIPHFRHKYNKFDEWFQRLLGDVLQIDDNEKKEFQKGFDEIFSALLKKMEEVDPLFKYLYRTFAPAGSSWEDLKICKPNEFDVNLILLSTDVQENVKVEYVGSGLVAIRLDGGFEVPENKVLKKINNDDRFKSNYESIKAQLYNWVEKSDVNRVSRSGSNRPPYGGTKPPDGRPHPHNHHPRRGPLYVSRIKVMRWLQRVVSKAVRKLRNHQWNSVKSVKSKKNEYNTLQSSTSGPAVTIKARLKNGKEFSIDLVPAFEFNQKYLPAKTQRKVRDKGLLRTWYAIPKGPTTASSPKMWRMSLYQAERDLMRGLHHLKPTIRIIKRLRDKQNWKILASYYIKTKFMWMMDEQNLRQMSLGQSVMLALESLEDAMRTCQIKYYWDDGLNLLDHKSDQIEFFLNTCGHITNIIKEFKKSSNGEEANPMQFFGW